MEDGPCVTPLMNTRNRVQKLHTVRRLLAETMATGLIATTFQYVPWALETFKCVHSRRSDLDIVGEASHFGFEGREFES